MIDDVYFLWYRHPMTDKPAGLSLNSCRPKKRTKWGTVAKDVLSSKQFREARRPQDNSPVANCRAHVEKLSERRACTLDLRLVESFLEHTEMVWVTLESFCTSAEFPKPWLERSSFLKIQSRKCDLAEPFHTGTSKSSHFKMRSRDSAGNRLRTEVRQSPIEGIWMRTDPYKKYWYRT